MSAARPPFPHTPPSARVALAPPCPGRASGREKHPPLGGPSMKSVELTGGASRPRATSASSRANSAAAAPPCPLSSSLFSAARRRREALPGPTSGAPPQSRPPPSSCLWPPPSARAHRTTTVGSLLLPILGGHEKLADGRRVKGGDADMCVCGLCSLKQRNFGRATCGGCRCAKDDGRERGGIIEG